jgi:hypothetical protein
VNTLIKRRRIGYKIIKNYLQVIRSCQTPFQFERFVEKKVISKYVPKVLSNLKSLDKKWRNILLYEIEDENLKLIVDALHQRFIKKNGTIKLNNNNDDINLFICNKIDKTLKYNILQIKKEEKEFTSTPTPTPTPPLTLTNTISTQTDSINDNESLVLDYINTTTYDIVDNNNNALNESFSSSHTHLLTSIFAPNGPDESPKTPTNQSLSLSNSGSSLNSRLNREKFETLMKCRKSPNKNNISKLNLFRNIYTEDENENEMIKEKEKEKENELEKDIANLASPISLINDNDTLTDTETTTTTQTITKFKPDKLVKINELVSLVITDDESEPGQIISETDTEQPTKTLIDLYNNYNCEDSMSTSRLWETYKESSNDNTIKPSVFFNNSNQKSLPKTFKTPQNKRSTSQVQQSLDKCNFKLVYDSYLTVFFF